jgi:hypothetical protein
MVTVIILRVTIKYNDFQHNDMMSIVMIIVIVLTIQSIILNAALRV